MPIYMDRHDVSQTVTAENVAMLHQEDLKVQHKFGCRGLTYWFDDERKTAFCLIEAPHEKAIEQMHKYAHGEVPHKIIEVDSSIVDAFLGRIEDPENKNESSLNIINEPAFRILMDIGLDVLSFKNQTFSLSSHIQNYYKAVNEITGTFNGRIVNYLAGHFLVSFKLVSKSVECALLLIEKFREFFPVKDTDFLDIKIGLSAGIPVTDKAPIFEDSVKLTRRLRYISNADVVLTSEVKDLYKSENLSQFFEGDRIIVLPPSDEAFLNRLMDFVEKEWQNSDLKVEHFNRYMGFSKSKLYRKMMLLTGQSPNTFLLNYRLKRALQLLSKQNGNISEVAFETGFNCPSYFSKAFRKKFGIVPSDYLYVTDL
jgi:AraC-like DNA-binding protein